MSSATEEEICRGGEGRDGREELAMLRSLKAPVGCWYFTGTSTELYVRPRACMLPGMTSSFNQLTSFRGKHRRGLAKWHYHALRVRCASRPMAEDAPAPCAEKKVCYCEGARGSNTAPVGPEGQVAPDVCGADTIRNRERVRSIQPARRALMRVRFRAAQSARCP